MAVHRTAATQGGSARPWRGDARVGVEPRSRCADGQRGRVRPSSVKGLVHRPGAHENHHLVVGSVKAGARALSAQSPCCGTRWPPSLSGYPGSPAVCPRHPLGCCGLGRASSPTTPASPPRRTSACQGGAKRLRFGRHREVAPRKGHNFRTTAVLRGFRDQTCPSLENRTEGEDAGIGPAELPRQQER